MNEQMGKSIRKAYHPELVVLVVEDHMMFCKDVKHALPQPHNVVFAHTVEDAKVRYEECLPHVIFLDLDLPDVNGFELLDYIREREPEAYVVILTGSKLKEDIAKAQEKGAQGYIFKPFTKSKIEQHIEQYWERRAKGIKSLLAETEKNRQDAVRNQPNAD